MMNNLSFTGKLGQNLYKAAQDLQKQANGVQLVRQAEELTGTSVMDSEDKTLLAKTKDILKDVNTKLYGGQPEQDSVSFSKPDVEPERPSFINVPQSLIQEDDDRWGAYTPGTKYAVFTTQNACLTY